MIFNQDIATTALSITILEGFAGIFSNSSKTFVSNVIKLQKSHDREQGIDKDIMGFEF